MRHCHCDCMLHCASMMAGPTACPTTSKVTHNSTVNGKQMSMPREAHPEALIVGTRSSLRRLSRGALLCVARRRNRWLGRAPPAPRAIAILTTCTRPCCPDAAVLVSDDVGVVEQAGAGSFRKEARGGGGGSACGGTAGAEARAILCGRHHAVAVTLAVLLQTCTLLALRAIV